MDTVFQELADLHDILGERFRSAAYAKIAKTITSLEQQFKISLANEDKWKNAPGIGESAHKKIIEYLKTGKIKKLDELKKSPEIKAIEKLTKIMGIGPVLAKGLYKDKNIKNITDLRKAMKDGLELTNEATLGVKHFADLSKRIPYKEMDKINEWLTSVAKSVGLTIQLAGSYRRNLLKSKRQSSGDVDVILTHPSVKVKADLQKSSKLKEFYQLISELPQFVACVKLGISSSTMLIKFDKHVRHMDVRLFPKESYWTALLHYTGSWEHNVKLRKVSISKNMMLTEYGLFKVNQKTKRKTRVKVESEEDVFEALEMKYVAPKNR